MTRARLHDRCKTAASPRYRKGSFLVREIVRKLFALLNKAERRRLGLLFVMIAVMGLLDMASVAALGPFLQVLSNPETTGSRFIEAVKAVLQPQSTEALLIWLAALALVFVIASLVFKALTIYAIIRFSHMRAFSLSQRLLSAHLRQPYAWFLGRHSADLGKGVLSEVDKVVDNALVPGLRGIAQFVVVVALVALLVITNPIAALIGFVFVVGSYGLVFVLTRKKLERIGAERVSANEARYRFAQEALGGIKEVKLHGLEFLYLNRFSKPAFAFADRQATAMVISKLPRYLLEAIVFGAMIALVLGLLITGGGRLDQIIPTIGIYAMAGARLFPALQELYQGISLLQFNGPAVNALYADLVEQTERAGRIDAGRDQRSLALRRRLAVRDVTFTYTGAHRAALHNLSLDIEANTTVGLVGSTGAGKTTVVDLILGLLEPESGHVAVDDVVLDRSNIRAWQNTLGYVPQHIFLIDDSVTANIALGVPPGEVDMDAVERAARIAELDRDIKSDFPDGYSTKLGEGGVRLSGGQRQRIGIARALYNDPSVLVLDEATSALDNITEKAVMDAVQNIAKAKTVILIAHRLSTVQACDKIVMLHRGAAIAEGTYDQLLQESREFQRLARASS
jgi:ABC-type multidrug transport system fused ATPase/permease subunit